MTEILLKQYLASPERTGLAARLLALMQTPARADESDSEFNELALEIFRFQYNRCDPFRRYCAASGCSPAVKDFRQIPGVPCDAFKYHRLACFKPLFGEVEFRTSGTAHGKQGSHFMPNTQLYDEGAVRWFLQHLMPAGELNLPDKSLLVSLTASPRMMPHSSLIHMIAAIGAKLGAEVEYLSERSMAEIVEIVRHAAKPILLFTTALALSDLLEHLADTKTDLPLPAGSRIMETGGYKGQRKRLGGEELYALASRKLGIPSRSIVNEYGMTEMSSQFYDRTLFSPELDEAEARIKHPAPWVRSLVLDPRTRKAAGEGEIGVLQHIDLANLDSCAFLLTADAARKRGTGFELIGRLDKLPLRGCSVGYEETRA